MAITAGLLRGSGRLGAHAQPLGRLTAGRQQHGWGAETLAELHFRRDFGVSMICIERDGRPIGALTTETRIERQDRLIVAGRQASVDALRGAILYSCDVGRNNVNNEATSPP